MNSIWVEVDGQVLNIIWNKALRLNIVNLPNIGDEVETNTGDVSFLGPNMWGDRDDYLGYNDFKHMDEDTNCKECEGDGWISDGGGMRNKRCPSCDGVRKYSGFTSTVTDCRIQTYKPYKKTSSGTTPISYLTYHDYTHFNYVLLCDVGLGMITITGGLGFDPDFNKKYHYNKYGTNDFYLVN